MSMERPRLQDLTAEEFNLLYPTTQLLVYSMGVKLVRFGGKGLCPPKAKKGKIMTLSKRSLSNLIWTAANTLVKFKSMATLTYGLDSPTTGKEAKAHLNRFLTGWKRDLGGFSYLWVMEFTANDRPHFHILTSICLDLQDDRLRSEFAWRWSRAVCGKSARWYCDLKTLQRVSLRERMFLVHRHPDSLKELWSDDGAIRYVTKYAAKLEQKEVPPQFADVGRFWGTSRDVAKSVKALYSVPIGSQDQLQDYLVGIGRDDLIDWEILPTKILAFN